MDDFFVSVTFIVLFYMIYKLFELFVCRKERMLLIEKIAEVNFENQLPGIPRFSWMKKRFYTNGVLRAGCLLSGVGIGLLSAYFIVLCSLPDYLSQDYSYGVRLFGDIVFFASALLGGGAGLIIAYWVEQKHDKKSE